MDYFKPLPLRGVGSRVTFLSLEMCPGESF